MPFNIAIPNSLLELGNLISLSANGPIYIYKNASGDVEVQNTEGGSSSNTFGYSFTFISGLQIYTTLPITTLLNIPWDYNYSILTASSSNLWNSSLLLWIDANETKSINTSIQKIVSKDYTSNVILVENTSGTNIFTHVAPSINLINLSSLETPAMTIMQYFKIGIVFTLTEFIIGRVIFQNNRLKVKLGNHTAPDTTTQNMIAIYDNNVFMKGIKVNSDINWKYYLITDQAGYFDISNNVSVVGVTPSYYQAINSKIFIGSDSTISFQSNIKIHEILYYGSASNNLLMSSANISTYLISRHSLLTYTDTSNVSPFTDPYEAYLQTGSLRLFTGDYGNTDGVSWHTFNGVQNSGDTNRLSGQCGVNNNQNGCLKCISLANTQYVSGFSGITTITPFTVVVLVRFTVNGGFTIVKFGSSTLWLIDVLATSGNMRINPTQGFYCDYDAGMALNTWYIVTYKYSGGLLSTAQVRINGLLKSVIGFGDGTPTTALTNGWTLPQSSGGTMFYGGLYLNNTAMTNATIEKVEGYFAWRLFSSGSMLTPSHPYYSVSPTF